MKLAMKLLFAGVVIILLAVIGVVGTLLRAEK